MWLNGGPGCSSLGGLITEHGPIVLSRNETQGVILNPYTWATHANMLYIEGPPGVGFSYCREQLGDPNFVCSSDDDLASSATLDALRSFFHKFPAFLHRDMYITGESYAGVYVPTLAKRVVESELMEMVNFKGWAVGDPCTDDRSQMDEIDFSPEFSLRHGIIDEILYSRLLNCVEDQSSEVCKKARYQFELAQGGHRAKGSPAILDPYNVYGISHHTGWDLAHTYLNRDDVKEAIHVAGTPRANVADSWSFCSEIKYQSLYDACNYAPKAGAISMLDIYRELAPKLTNVLLYNGDVDPSVDAFGSQRAAYALGFGVLQGGEWRPWTFDQHGAGANFVSEKFEGFGQSLTVDDVGEQLGGYVVNFANNFTFLTLHGSGHMTPQYKPQASLEMFKRFLENAPYADPIVYPEDL